MDNEDIQVALSALASVRADWCRSRSCTKEHKEAEKAKIDKAVAALRALRDA